MNPFQNIFPNAIIPEGLFNNTDHLGNIRVSYTKDPQTGNLKILDESHYYPFGLKHQEYQISGFVKSEEEVIVAPLAHNPYQYKYNGKEWQDELGLNFYDYGARNYDPAIGRWMNMDPLADKYTNLSPYSYVMNNVVNAIDPDGRLIIFIGGLRMKAGAWDQIINTGFYKDDSHYNYGWATKEGEVNFFGKVANISNLFAQMHGDYNHLYTSGSSTLDSSANKRRREGVKNAKRFYKRWKKEKVRLVDGEVIRIVSHSQGGAHAAGFADQLLTYKDENGESIFNIEVIYYITPHQGAKITSPEGIMSFQFSHPNDAVSGEGFGWISLFNGGQFYGEIKNITEFFEDNIFGGENQPESTGAFGNRNGHNVTDNYDYILGELMKFCKKKLEKCKEIQLDPSKVD